MTSNMTRHLMIAAAAAALAACSSAVSQEISEAEPNTAIVVQSAPELVADLAPTSPMLDGAPKPLILPEAAPEHVAPPVITPPVIVQQASFTCDIDVVRTDNGVRITPVVRAGRSMDGDYTLIITKTGASGSSDISQGGPFDAARGERIKLGASEISFERGDGYRAVLKVRANGREICRDVRSQ